MGQDDPCLLPKRKKRDHVEGGPVTRQLHECRDSGSPGNPAQETLYRHSVQETRLEGAERQLLAGGGDGPDGQASILHCGSLNSAWVTDA